MTLPVWSTSLSLDFMNRNGIGTTILSLSAPRMSVVKGEKEAISLCRKANEFAASIRDENPSRFRFFATLLSLDAVSICVEEIAFAFDVLKADGVILNTSYDHRYLGHSDFRPIWIELDRRLAVVFIHPTINTETGALTSPYIPQPLIDFPHETTRTAIHLILSNTIRDHRNCKIILSHAGGTLPYIATRVFHLIADEKFSDKSTDECLEEAQSFYYDLALAAYSHTLDLLVKFAKPDHILYGSDFPFAREITSSPQLDFLNRCTLPDEVDFSIRRGAALKLFPRLGKC